MEWAIAQQRVTDAPARHVLLVLARTASVEGEDAWRTVERLAKETGLSERTVQMKLQLLLAAGVMRLGDQNVVAVKIKRVDRRPTVYDLDVRLEELEAAGFVYRKGARGAADAPRTPVDNAGDGGRTRGAGDAPRSNERGAADAATGCSSPQERGAGDAPTSRASSTNGSSPAQAGASAQAHPPARGWRRVPESPLESAIALIRQTYDLGGYGEGPEAKLQRDRLIAEARRKHVHEEETHA